MSTLSPAESRQIEDEYARYREEVMGLLARGFRRLPDREEIYQEAWTELLELRAAGTPLGDLRMMLRTIAWRRAADRTRNERHADPFDPASHLFGIHADAMTPPDEEAQIHLDAAIARLIVDSLDERHAAVIKLRFESHMDSREIREQLGVSAKRLEKIVTEAYRCVEAQLVAEDGGEAPYRRRQRSLLLACLMGQASTAQVERARHMVAEDAGCRAMLRHLHFTMNGVAALTPAPMVIADRELNRGIPVLDQVGDTFAWIKQFLTNLVSRGENARMSSEQVAGGAATLGGVSAAAKVALTCIAVGATAICLDSTRQQAPPPSAHYDVPPRQHRLHLPSPAPTVTRAPAKRAAPTATHATPRVHHGTRTVKPLAPRSASAPPPPTPAPTGSTEFGPGNLGSGNAAPTPAAAPSGGGGEFQP